MPLDPYELNFVIQCQQIEKSQRDHEVARDISSALQYLAKSFELQEQPYLSELFVDMSHKVRMLGSGGFNFVDMPTPFTDAVKWWFFDE